MNKLLCAVSALSLTAGAASAAGLDRSNQSMSPLFNDPGTAQLSFGFVQPSLTGKDDAGNEYDAGKSYTQTSLSWTNDINEAFSYSVIVDEPYGADIDYNNDPTTSALGGTLADLDSQALTLVGRYKVNPSLSFHAGLSVQRITAEVLLNGTNYQAGISASLTTQDFNANSPSGTPNLTIPELAEGAAAAARIRAAIGGGGAPDPADLAVVGAFDAKFGTNTLAGTGPIPELGTNLGAFVAGDGYSFDMGESIATQPLIGMAYELPDIALRFAATYFLETEHGADTEEEVFGTRFDGDIDFVAPQALNLDFQTGIATDTLLTASYRWVQYSAVDLVPDRLGSDLVNLDDGRRWTLGVARRFTDEWAGSFTFLYEPKGEDEFVSPLGPTNGLRGITLAARYESGGLTASAGVNYSLIGDASAEVGGIEAARFEDNSSTAFGLQIAYQF